MLRAAAAGRIGQVVAVATALALAAAVPAAAEQADRSEVVELAQRAAAGDAGATARLRSVDRIDGRPADLARALDAEPGARSGALASWEGGGIAPPPGDVSSDGDAARRQAEDVLDGSEFHPSRTPRPLRAVLEWIGDALEPAFGPAVRLLARLWDGRLTRLLLALAAVGLVTVVTGLLARRRERGARRDTARRRRAASGETPEVLERAADAAEAAGDRALAYRLRFRAGVMRLVRAGTVPDRPDLTTGGLRHHIRSPAFDALAVRFDEVVYGGDEARAADLAAVRTGWSAVRAEAAPRADDPPGAP